jgi:hypothetical protein
MRSSRSGLVLLVLAPFVLAASCVSAAQLPQTAGTESATPPAAMTDAAPPRLEDWAQSPEHVLLATRKERDAWRRLSTDAERTRFVDLFWAKRDPDPATARNEFRERFDALVATADRVYGGEWPKVFTGCSEGKVSAPPRRGALTEAGRAFVLIGPPAPPDRSKPGRPGDRPPAVIASSPLRACEVAIPFSWSRAELPSWADVDSLFVEFRIDVRTHVEKVVGNVRALRRLQERAAVEALVHPELTEAPVLTDRLTP